LIKPSTEFLINSSDVASSTYHIPSQYMLGRLDVSTNTVFSFRTMRCFLLT